MNFVVLLMAVGLMNSPFVGDWKLDPSRTRLPDTMKVAYVSGDTYSFNFAGTPETIVVNGKDQPGIQGTTLSVTAEGPDSWKVVRKKDGQMLLTADWSLSKDGKTITDAFTQVQPDGARATFYYIYDRTEGDTGFAGTWHSTRLASNTDLSLKIQPYEGDGLSFMDVLEAAPKNLKIDGREYPAAAPAGLASSAKRVDEHTIEITDTFKGKTIATEEMKLSADGKTLTMTTRTPGGTEPNILVFERQ